MLTSLPAVLFTRLTDPTAHAAELAWPASFSRVEDFILREEKDGYLWSPVLLHEHETRIHNDGVRALTALVYDLDHVPVEALPLALSAFAEMELCCHTSFNHTPTAPRMRLVLPLEEPVPPAVHRMLWEWGAARIHAASGYSVDVACKDPARRYFYPACPSSRHEEAIALHQSGVLLSSAVLPATRAPATAPATAPVPAPATTPARSGGLFSRAAQAQAERDRTLRQDLDVSLIEASCGFMRAARDRAAEQIKEPEWHSALSIWLRCEDGDALAHARSSSDPRYTHEETSRKLDQLRRATLEQGIGPSSCQYIRGLSVSAENACAAACSGCRIGAPLGPIRSPASLGMRAETATTRADAAARRVEDLDDAISQADTPEERKVLRAERAEANREKKEATSAATRAATLATIASTGGRIFTRGDHAELSLALVGDLTATAGGVSPVSALGRLYLHDTTTGTWVDLLEHRLENHVATYAGTPIAGPRPAAQRINRSDQTGVSAMVASAIRAVSPDPLPTSVGVAFGDGMLLPDGSFRPYVPGDYVLAEHVLPVCYRTTTGEAPPRPARWLRFLEEVYAGEHDIRERVAVVQEFLGAALLGVATSYQKSLVLLGETGANGKSVMLRVASCLFPTSAVGAIAPHHLAGGSSEYYRAMLLRIRLNVVSELPEHELMDTSALKAAIAGDELIAREIREAPIRGRPRAAWIIAANALPPVRDTSGGYWRRQLVITHNVRFGLPGGPAADPHLADYLLEHELPGIAAWAAEGGRRLLVQGQYTALASSDAVVANWARDNDPMLRFYEDHLIPDTTAPPMLASKIYAAYRQWSQENGHNPVASARLFRRFSTSFDLPSAHTRAGNTYNVHIVGLAGFASRPVPTTTTTTRSTTPTAEA